MVARAALARGHKSWAEWSGDLRQFRRLQCTLELSTHHTSLAHPYSKRRPTATQHPVFISIHDAVSDRAVQIRRHHLPRPAHGESPPPTRPSLRWPPFIQPTTQVLTASFPHPGRLLHPLHPIPPIPPHPPQRKTSGLHPRADHAPRSPPHPHPQHHLRPFARARLLPLPRASASSVSAMD